MYIRIIICLTCCLLLSCGKNIEADESTKKSKVAIIGHFYPLLKPEHLTTLKAQLKSIDGLKAIILAGDMIPSSSLANYNLLKHNLISYFKIPIFYIPANHEMGNEKLFTNFVSQFSKIGNRVFYVKDNKYIIHSSHIANVSPSKAKLNCQETEFLKQAILDQSRNSSKSILVLADIRCFRKPHWKRNIHNLIKKHIDLVVIGDNEASKYNYTWEEYLGIPFIFQGITHRGHHLSGDNSFLVIDENGAVELHHLNIKNALDKSYKTNRKFKILK